jgi:hypothetical protein
VQQQTRLAITLGLQDLGSALSLGQALADTVERRAIDHAPDDRRAIAGDGSDEGVAIALDCLHLGTLKKSRPTHSCEGRRRSCWHRTGDMVAGGGALTRGWAAAPALIGGPYVGETASLRAICKVDR